MAASVVLEIEPESAATHPAGDVLYGSIEVTRGTPGEATIELTLLERFRRGDVTNDRRVSREVLMEGRDVPAGRYPFRLQLPSLPTGFAGELFEIEHVVEGRLIESDSAVAAEAVVRLVPPPIENHDALHDDAIVAAVSIGDELQDGGFAEALRSPPASIREWLDTLDDAIALGDWQLRRRDRDGHVVVELEGPSDELDATPGYDVQIAVTRAVAETPGGRLAHAVELVVAADGRRLSMRGHTDDARVVDGLPWTESPAETDRPATVSISVLARIALILRDAGATLSRWDAESEATPPTAVALLNRVPPRGTLDTVDDREGLTARLAAWPRAAGEAEILYDEARAADPPPVDEREAQPDADAATHARRLQLGAIGVLIVLALVGIIASDLLEASFALWATAVIGVVVLATIFLALARRGRAAQPGSISVLRAPLALACGDLGTWKLAAGQHGEGSPTYWTLERIEIASEGEATRHTERTIVDDGPIRWTDADANGSCESLIRARIPEDGPATWLGSEARLRWRLALYRETSRGDELALDSPVVVLPVAVG